MTVRHVAGALAMLTLLAAGAARSAPAAGLADARALAAAVRAALPPAAPKAQVLLPPAYAKSYEMRVAGIAQTSVDRKLSSDDLTGSLGFLCGLQPGTERTGAAAARGYDPSGRFLGAKLSLAFR